jgi:hypothetical protein
MERVSNDSSNLNTRNQNGGCAVGTCEVQEAQQDPGQSLLVVVVVFTPNQKRHPYIRCMLHQFFTDNFPFMT